MLPFEFTRYKKNILNNYNGNPETLDIDDILKKFYDQYQPNEHGVRASLSSKISAFKGELLLKTIVENYESGKQYNEEMIKTKQKPILIGRINDLKMQKKDSGLLRTHQITQTNTRSTQEQFIDKNIVDELLKLVKSDKPIEIVIGLCIATGRRITEITKTAKFYKIRNNQHLIEFSGTLKTNNDQTKYTIPVLVPSQDAIDALKKIRMLFNTKKMTNEECDQVYGAKARYCLKTSLKKNGFEIEMTIHTLRSLYISYLYQFKNPNNITKSQLIEKHLCHDSRVCSDNYNYWVIRDSNEERPSKKVKIELK